MSDFFSKDGKAFFVCTLPSFEKSRVVIPVAGFSYIDSIIKDCSQSCREMTIAVDTTLNPNTPSPCKV